jgi:hypothetical protein
MMTLVARAIGQDASGKNRNRMRSVLALGLLIALDSSANGTPLHRHRARPHVPAIPRQGVTAPAAPTATPRFAVPGWSDEDTRRWLDGAGSLWRGA